MLIDANEGEGGVMNSEKVVEKPTLYVCLALCSVEAVRATIAVALPLASALWHGRSLLRHIRSRPGHDVT